jgi:hypothetical protein
LATLLEANSQETQSQMSTSLMMMYQKLVQAREVLQEKQRLRSLLADLDARGNQILESTQTIERTAEAIENESLALSSYLSQKHDEPRITQQTQQLIQAIQRAEQAYARASQMYQIHAQAGNL